MTKKHCIVHARPVVAISFYKENHIAHIPIDCKHNYIYPIALVYVVYTKTIMISFLKTYTLKPVYKGLHFQAHKMLLSCK